MKISSDWYAKGLGKAWVIWSAPWCWARLFRTCCGSTQGLPWKAVLWATSAVALFGGCCSTSW
ncbi:MAG: hypothetical protein H6573_02810 [Lewinellaceae bacterium]|nr:hypothetical protein [Lewinellaceae bacterium]